METERIKKRMRETVAGRTARNTMEKSVAGEAVLWLGHGGAHKFKQVSSRNSREGERLRLSEGGRPRSRVHPRVGEY